MEYKFADQVKELKAQEETLHREKEGDRKEEVIVSIT